MIIRVLNNPHQLNRCEVEILINYLINEFYILTILRHRFTILNLSIPIVLKKINTMKKILLVLAFLFPLLSIAQNVPQCDSLIINCCNFTSGGPNTISLDVSNYTTELFGYPAFTLMTTSNDTIAKENPNYFGIGGGPQTHVMNIINPLSLPFTGYLNLYVGFFDSLYCSFPITINDTLSGFSSVYNNANFNIFPNPTKGNVIIQSDRNIKDATIRIVNVIGKVIYEINQNNFSSLNLDLHFVSGLYIIEVWDKDEMVNRKKLVIE